MSELRHRAQLFTRPMHSWHVLENAATRHVAGKDPAGWSGPGSGHSGLADVEQFLYETADLPIPVDQVDLQDPVAGLPGPKNGRQARSPRPG